MDTRLANTWRLTVNEKRFIETALSSGIRIDGRNPFEYRKLSIKEDGSSEVQLGQTHIMGFVTGQLVQPYRDRPNEGTLSIFTEFSPMADPSFETGRPSESAVELGRIVDRGLRESRAVDTESLCVLAGKLVWAILTFGFFSSESLLVIDPTHHEEAVMVGKMTATLNANGDVCAIQKPGGEGVLQSVIMQCLRLASRMASDITKKIKDAVETYNTERALRKIKRHPTSITLDGSVNLKEKLNEPSGHNVVNELSRKHLEKPRLASAENASSPGNNGEGESKSSNFGRSSRRDGATSNFVGGAASWDPYSRGVDSDFLKASLASRGTLTPKKKQQDPTGERKPNESKPEESPGDVIPTTSAMDVSETGVHKGGEKTLKDAVKPKHKRKKKAFSSTADAS
ncbi:hypothetical protein CUMW_101880 [Citrus unshiu]|nr:hypothetical protein CUMW_101880 [Citrus unshiu]